MELIPIIQESLLFFIGILVVVLTVSYLLFKFNNKKDEKEFLQRHANKSEYSRFLSEQTYTRPVNYIEHVPQYYRSPEKADKVPERIKSLNRTSRYTILNESKIEQTQFYKPIVTEFSDEFEKINLRNYQ